MTLEEILAAIGEMGAEELDQLAAAVNAKLAESDEVKQEGCGDCEEPKEKEGEEGETPAEAPAEEIQQLVEAIGEELDQIEQVVDAIEGRRSTLKQTAQKRSKMIDQLRSGMIGTVVRKAPGVELRKDVETMEFDQKKEYRSAWLNKMRGMPLSDVEKRAYANATGTGAEVVPEELQNEIITKVKKLAPMLGEITLLHAKGGIRYAVEGVNNAAAIHSENAEITAAEDTLVEVVLGAYEIAKLVTVGDTVRTMSIDSFEGWLTDRLAEAIARKIEDLIINGDGSNKPTGINKAYASWTDNTNQVTVAAASSLTAANVQTLIGLLPAGYDRNAKFVMNKKTLFTDFMPLQDKNKYDLVQTEGGNYHIYGYPVMISDYVADHIAFLGDFTKVVANMAEDINVHNDYDITHNNYRYSGVAIFDCKPALAEAFVKLNKASV